MPSRVREDEKEALFRGCEPRGSRRGPARRFAENASNSNDSLAPVTSEEGLVGQDRSPKHTQSRREFNRRYLGSGRRLYQSRLPASSPAAPSARDSAADYYARTRARNAHGAPTLHSPRERNTKVGIYFCRDSQSRGRGKARGPVKGEGVEVAFNRRR